MAQTQTSELHSRASNEPCDDEVSLGIASSQARTSFLDVSGGTKTCTDSDRKRLAFEGEIVSSSRSGSVSLQQSLAGTFEYRFARRWFATVEVNEEANRDIGIESRVSLAPGAGYQVSPRWGFFLIEGGFTRTWQNDIGSSPASFPEVWAGTKTRWKNSNGVSLTESLDFYAKTGDIADHHWFSNTELRFRLTERFSLKSTVRFQWDNVPAVHYPKTSVTTRTEFVYSFGRS